MYYIHPPCPQASWCEPSGIQPHCSQLRNNNRTIQISSWQVKSASQLLIVMAEHLVYQFAAAGLGSTGSFLSFFECPPGLFKLLRQGPGPCCRALRTVAQTPNKQTRKSTSTYVHIKVLTHANVHATLWLLLFRCCVLHCVSKKHWCKHCKALLVVVIWLCVQHRQEGRDKDLLTYCIYTILSIYLCTPYSKFAFRKTA